MKTINIKGSKRESVGKKASKSLRNAEKVPCVLYGGDKNVIHFSAPEKAFKNLIYTPNVYTATIDLEGKEYVCILQDIQFHPVTDKVLHMDFYKLSENKEVSLDIPLKIVGNSPGVMAGGSLRKPNRKLKIKALPKDLPDFIEADISKLNIGDKLYVSDIATKNYIILHPENTIIAQVKMSRKAKSETNEEKPEEKKQKTKS